MTAECVFCKGTGIEPGFTDCVWCENSGRAEGITPEGIKRACAEIKAARESLERKPVGGSEMDGVKRYGFKYDGMFEMAAPGGWVKATDYDVALAREALLKREIEIAAEHVCEVEDREAALREELAGLQQRFDRTESALNGSMKTLTRVDNMWKKRWLDKTGEASVSLIVDDEFKALFEEIKDYRKRLTAAEQRNARYESLLRQIIPCLAMSTNSTAPTYIRQINEALPKPTESGVKP